MSAESAVPAERVAFVGGGNMAFALATGLMAAQPTQVVVAEPLAAARARFDQSIDTTADNVDAVREAAVVVLAVKPQVVETVARQIAPALGRTCSIWWFILFTTFHVQILPLALWGLHLFQYDCLSPSGH